MKPCTDCNEFLCPEHAMSHLDNLALDKAILTGYIQVGQTKSLRIEAKETTYESPRN